MFIDGVSVSSSLLSSASKASFLLSLKGFPPLFLTLFHWERFLRRLRRPASGGGGRGRPGPSEKPYWSLQRERSMQCAFFAKGKTGATSIGLVSMRRRVVPFSLLLPVRARLALVFPPRVVVAPEAGRSRRPPSQTKSLLPSFLLDPSRPRFPSRPNLSGVSMSTTPFSLH